MRVIAPAGVPQKSSVSEMVAPTASEIHVGANTEYHDGPTGAPVCIAVKLPKARPCVLPLSRYSRACILESCVRK